MDNLYRKMQIRKTAHHFDAYCVSSIFLVKLQLRNHSKHTLDFCYKQLVYKQLYSIL